MSVLGWRWSAAKGANEGYRIVRTVFGRSILLGLEFLVAADIIRTVASPMARLAQTS